jgi:hypothetical protein
MARPFSSRAGFIVTVTVFRAPWRLLVLRRCLSSLLRGPRAIECRFATFIVGEARQECFVVQGPLRGVLVVVEEIIDFLVRERDILHQVFIVRPQW